MIVAAAQLQNCVLLLTEDLQDGAVFGAVTVRSRPPAHRGRGRPRRLALAAV